MTAPGGIRSPHLLIITRVLCCRATTTAPFSIFLSNKFIKELILKIYFHSDKTNYKVLLGFPGPQWQLSSFGYFYFLVFSDTAPSTFFRVHLILKAQLHLVVVNILPPQIGLHRLVGGSTCPGYTMWHFNLKIR